MASSTGCAGQFRYGVGGFVVVWGTAFAVYFVIQFLQRDSLGASSADDAYAALLFGDMVGAVVAVCAGIILLLPAGASDDLPRTTRSFGAHYCCVLLLLLVGLVSLSITSRVRDVNMQLRSADDHISSDENYVCGRRTDVLSCPTQRIELSDAFRLWQKLHPGRQECWLNTSDVSVFTFGESLANATKFPTADFSRRDTYVEFPEYAECWLYGCGCVPEQREFNANLLRAETFATMLAVVTFFLFVCAPSPADEARGAYAPSRV